MDFAKVANLFARKVVKGHIPACKFVQLACDRHLEDLKRSRYREFPYKFDKEEVQKRIEFMQLLPHTKGEWAYQRKLITFEPWQIFGLACIFGWKRKKDKLRRFTEAYWEIPRKNGKSILAAAVGLSMFTDPSEFGAEVYSGATTEKQAWEVFKPARLMVLKTPQLASAFDIDVRAKKMIITDDESVFEPIIGNPGDGQSPSCALIDEYHEHDTSDLYETMRTGMLARKQPLIFIITTAGDNIAGPCYEKRGEVIDVLNGIIPGDRTFGYIWTIDEKDEWTDPEVVKKANPNFGVSVYEHIILQDQKDAVNTPRAQSAFKTKNLNVWVGSRTAYFNLEKWKACEEAIDESDFEGQECHLGCDLAAKTDLNAKVKVFTRMIEGVRHYYVVSPTFWVPHDTIYYNEDNKRLAEIYKSFKSTGEIDVVQGAEMDYRTILSECKSDNKKFVVNSCGIDPHGATCLLHELDEEGMDPVIIQQNFTGMSDGMKEVDAAIKGGRLHQDGNPLLTWCISNVTGKYMTGNDDIVRPTKETPDKKIDGAVALIMAIGLAMTAEAPRQSIYNKTQL